MSEEDCLQYFKKTQEKAELMKKITKNEILLGEFEEKLSLEFRNERKYTFKKEIY